MQRSRRSHRQANRAVTVGAVYRGTQSRRCMRVIESPLHADVSFVTSCDPGRVRRLVTSFERAVPLRRPRRAAARASSAPGSDSRERTPAPWARTLRAPASAGRGITADLQARVAVVQGHEVLSSSTDGNFNLVGAVHPAAHDLLTTSRACPQVAMISGRRHNARARRSTSALTAGSSRAT